MYENKQFILNTCFQERVVVARSFHNETNDLSFAETAACCIHAKHLA